MLRNDTKYFFLFTQYQNKSLFNSIGSAEILTVFKRRCQKNLNLTCGDKINLKQQDILVQDLPTEDALTKINNLLDSCDVDNMMFSFEPFSMNGQDSFTFDHYLKQFFFWKEHGLNKEQERESYEIERFLLIIKDFLEKYKSIRLRALYYIPTPRSMIKRV